MQATKTKKGIIVDFNFERLEFRTTVVDIQANSDHKTFANLINSDLIDVVEYNDEIDIVIDDEGLHKGGNPAFEIQTKYGSCHLVGKLLFLKKEYANDGVRLVGMEAGEAFNLLLELDKKICLCGVTR